VAIRQLPHLELEVLRVLEDWTTPRYHDATGTPVEIRRFRVRVFGILRGIPAAEGAFVMTVRCYGKPAGLVG
jgi:hypothetical protein